MFQVNVFPPDRFLLLQQRQQRISVYVLRHFSAGNVNKCRQNIPDFHHLFQMTSRFYHCSHIFRQTEHKRDMDRTFISIRFTPVVMIAEHITVVGYKQNHRIFIQSFLFQRLDNTSDLVVNKSNRRIIVTPRIHCMFLAIISESSTFRFRVVCKCRIPVTGNRFGNCNMLVHIQITLRRIIRTMGTCK